MFFIVCYMFITFLGFGETGSIANMSLSKSVSILHSLGEFYYILHNQLIVLYVHLKIICLDYGYNNTLMKMTVNTKM